MYTQEATTALVPEIVAPDFDGHRVRSALGGFLAGYSDSTRDAYELDLRQWVTWCAGNDIEVFAVRRTHIDLLGYAMQFLPEDHSRLDRLLIDKAARGCRVRIALADPDSPYVAERDEEEALGGTLPDRIRTTIDHFEPLFGVEGTDLRFHHTRMYNSVFRGDDEMFVTPHLYALKGYRAPLLHVRRSTDDGMFDAFVAHFERVWSVSQPIPAP